MQTQLKTDEFFNPEELNPQHDAHIKAYQALNLGIKVTVCDSQGIPVSDSFAPLSPYLPNTFYNM